MRVTEKLKNQSNIFKDHDVLAAYLYGSYAENREDEQSDLDIGVLFQNFDNLKQVTELQRDLESDFNVELDLRPLNTDDIVFKKEVLSNGKLVFESDKERRIDFEESVMRRYLDMKPYIERYYSMRSERLEDLKA
jgi:predicted nucleotidyltransferase